MSPLGREVGLKAQSTHSLLVACFFLRGKRSYSSDPWLCRGFAHFLLLLRLRPSRVPASPTSSNPFPSSTTMASMLLALSLPVLVLFYFSNLSSPVLIFPCNWSVRLLIYLPLFIRYDEWKIKLLLEELLRCPLLYLLTTLKVTERGL